MTSRRTLLGVVALLVATVACTRPEAVPSTEPLALPDSFAPSTTVTTQAGTTTTVDIERAAIYPVDPVTLEALDGFDPIPMGDWYDWYWADVSDNGSWLAMNVGQDDRDVSEVRLINIDAWETVATWAASYGSSIQVSNDGTVYSVTSGSPNPQKLSRMSASLQQPVIVAKLPPGFYAWPGSHLNGDQAVMFGPISGDINRYNTGEATIVTVDLATGAVREIPLPGVEVGIIAEVDIGEAFPGLVDASPAVVWDHEVSKALIVHATRQVVTEVDLATGKVTEHQFGAEVWRWGPLFTGTTGQGGGAFVGNSRVAVLSQDERALYVATTVGEFVVGDEGWSATTTSTGIATIDTENWQIVDRLDAPISEVHLSPDGDRLLATGYSYTEGTNEYEYTSSGSYVIDPVGLEVIAHHDPDQADRNYGAFSFSNDSHLGYVTSWGQQANIDVVDLETGAILHTRSDPEIQIFGEVGILGEVRQGP
ncbi:MAG: hypothetical protein WED83_08495 [Acidimicrobiia bacterium]